MNKLKNKAATLVIEITAMSLLIGACSALFLSRLNDTRKDGTLKKNGKRIWCKMTNKGKDYCDALYK